MMCQRCGNHEATFHYTTTVNGVTREQHLCPQCAKALGLHTLRSSGLFTDDFFSRPWSLFAPLFGDMEGMGARLLTEFPAPSQATREAHAAVAERPAQEGTLVDGAEREALQRERRRNALRNRLQAAIDSEQYEEAATLRDQLKALEG